MLKFGGAALRDGAGVRAACRIVTRSRMEDGRGPAVVVSAHHGVTDQLEELGRAAADGRVDPGPVRIRHRGLLRQLRLPSDLLDRYWRALDALLSDITATGRLEAPVVDRLFSFGERLSARVVARALADHGVPATPIDAWDLGLVTDSRHGDARPLEGVGGAIAAALEQVPGVPVVTGFLAKDAAGRLTTLGRNGSDLTAAILAEAVGADELQYWKTVPGILSADPGLVPGAFLLERVGHEEAAELAHHGARVLHPSALAPARRAGVPVRVACVHDPDAPGTRLVEGAPGVGPRAVAVRERVLAVRLAAPSPARLFEALDACGVTPWLAGVDGQAVEALVEPGPGVPAALAELAAASVPVSVERDLASLALVGEGIGADGDLSRRSLARLSAANVRVRRLELSGRRSSLAFVVHEADLRRAAACLHGMLPAPADSRPDRFSSSDAVPDSSPR